MRRVGGKEGEESRRALRRTCVQFGGFSWVRVWRGCSAGCGLTS